jgi:metal-responsive CopG/Arc/MetJ family transcriptional regulator
MLTDAILAEYFGSMKAKTSITLSADTMRELDRVAGRSGRSRVIETAVAEYLVRRARAARDARDRDLLDQQAEALNEEAAAALAFQVRL